jgi:nitroimidazol reductase NimA-like FMN-containing flavoprotein (pyridoxamine 5'-phosphate oxidase superfamily)
VSDAPYVVPVAFGYDGHDLYFHTARTGKKIDCMAANPCVCFEMERNVHLLRHPRNPCKWSFAFESVIGYGTTHELRSAAEKAAGLNHVLAHYSGGHHQVDGPALDRTRVWKVSISSLTGKRSQLSEATA